ncbi:LysE family transporter, partial [Staphylococcus aureus]|uniref:LysE family transporter n=1 Tax=Staphylococcus aureus TaxID=1280 RepID=UPI00210AA2C9
SLPVLQLFISIVGLFFLLYMAWSLWKEKHNTLENYEPMSTKKQIGFAISVSLLNPHAIKSLLFASSSWSDSVNCLR